MTLPTSGAISFSQIQSEFSTGTNLNAYRSQRWFLDTNARGYFPSGTISFSDFYSKRKSSPVTAGSATYYNSGTVPFPAMFNNLTVTAVSGQGGTAGADGNCRGGTGGGYGGATNFGTYVSTGSGSPAGYGGTGTRSTNSTSWAITDANQASIIALYNQGVSSGVGGGGYAGGGGAYKNTVCACLYYDGHPYCVCTDKCDQGQPGGSAGGVGYISLSWS